MTERGDGDAPVETGSGADRLRRLLGAILGFAVLGGIAAWVAGLPGLLAEISDAVAIGALLALTVAVTALGPRGEGTDGPLPWPGLRLALAALAAAAVLLLGLTFDALQPAIARPTLAMTGIGIAALAVATAASWWRLGPVMPVLVLLFCALVLWIGPSLPPRFATVPISPERLAAYLAFDSNGLMSRLLFIAAGTIAPFVIFGTLFARLGADRAIAEPLLYLMRNCVGGPSKAAVLSSTAFGLVSGSAVANVSTSAPITVPMMLRDRISRAEAAGIEAVASSVGQVMPPVMGASAFLMAEWLGRPYRDIVLAATVPALLCVVFLILIVDFDARRRAASEAAPPPVAPPVTALPWAGLVRVVLPLVALGFALFHGGIAPGRAALMATALVVALHLALPGGGRPAARVSAILAAAQASVPAITGVMLLTAMAALVMALLQVSGASFMLTQRLIDLSQGSFALLALLTTALVLFLGLGMPTIGVYVLAASLCAPVLAAGGTDPLAAHLFILFVGMLSMVTPPVAMASLTAAMIAGAPLWRTCAHGMRFGAGLTLVAAAILIQPALVAPLDDPRFMAAVLPLMLALGLVAAALAGHVGFAVGAAGRLVMLAAALAALSAMASAEVGPAWWLTLAIGASLLAVQTAAGRRMLGTIVARRRPS